MASILSKSLAADNTDVHMTHICEHHPDAIKPVVHTITDVAPVTLPAPATRAVHNPSPPPAAPTTPQLAAVTRESTATCSPLKTLPLYIHLKVYSSQQLYSSRPVQPQLPFTDLPEPVSHQPGLLKRFNDDTDCPWMNPTMV